MGSAKLILVAGACVSVGALAGPTLTTAAVDKVQDVFVKNTAEQPIPIDAAQPIPIEAGQPIPIEVQGTPPVAQAGTPVQFAGQFAFNGSSTAGSTDYAVPAGKRLRVDHVTFTDVGNAAKVEWLVLRTRRPNTFHSIVTQQQASDSEVASQPFLAYADPETNVDFLLELDRSIGGSDLGTFLMHATFTGVLLDA